MPHEPPERRGFRSPLAAPRARRPEPKAEVFSAVPKGPSARRVAMWTKAVLAAAAPRSRASVSVLLCADTRMRRLNREFRKIDRPTDVLSFPAGDPEFLGDVAIDVPYAARQAGRRGHSLDREVKILLVHGVLHLLGHDHETDQGEMFRLQGRLVAEVFGPGPDGVGEDEA